MNNAHAPIFRTGFSVHKRLPHIVLLAVALIFLTAGCDKPEEKAARYIERGNALYEKQEYVKARLEYKNAARLQPASAEVRYRLGLLDEAQGDLQNAFANFVQAEQQDKAYSPALVKLAQYFMASDALAESRKRIDTVLSAEPDHPEAHAILAAVFLRQGDFQGAEKEARFALSKDPANISATSVLTGLYQKQGNTEKAGAALEEGIAKNPQDLSLRLLKVTLYEKANDGTKVREAYQGVFNLKPEETAHRLSFANYLVKTGAKDEAEIFLRESIKAIPNDWTLRRSLIGFLGSVRNLEVAEKELQGYIEQNPGKDDLYFWLADLYIAHKDIDKAAALLRRIVDSAADTAVSLNARSSLARLQFHKGDRALAEKLIAAVLEKEPSHQDALFIRASIAYDDGAYQQAITDLRTVLRDNPKARQAYMLLGEALLKQGRLDLAIDTIGQLIDRFPLNNAPARARLAQFYDAAGNPAQGLAILETVTKSEPDYPVGWESTARLALSANKLDLAETAITKLAALKGQEATADLLKGKLYTKQGKVKEAREALEALTTRDPTSPLAEHAMLTLTELPDNASLITFLETITPRTAFIENMLGERYAREKQFEKAEAAFDAAIAAQAPMPDPYMSRAKLYLRSKAYEKALPLLEQATKIAPANYLAPLLIGDTLREMGKYEDAIKAYDALLVRNPEVHAAANNLADLIANRFSHDGAMLEKARLRAERFISSPNPLLLDTLAWVYFRQGKIEQALTIMERAFAIKAELPPQIHYHYGAMLLAAGDKDKARPYLEKATAQGSTYDGIEEAKKLLASLR